MNTLLNEFTRIEEGTNGRHKFNVCPHIAETGQADANIRFINLVDDPGRTVTLALCGICCNVVTGALVGDIIRQITIDGIKLAFTQAKDKGGRS